MSLLWILYNIVTLATALRCSKESHFSVSSIALTLLTQQLSFKTYRAALRWMDSILVLLFLVGGSQTQLAYSAIGRTSVLYQCALIARGQLLRLRRKKPRHLMHFLKVLLTWVFHESLLFNSTPRYLDDVHVFFELTQKGL